MGIDYEKINTTKNQDWKAFARGYNGAVYTKNSYDVKLSILIKSG